MYCAKLNLLSPALDLSDENRALTLNNAYDKIQKIAARYMREQNASGACVHDYSLANKEQEKVLSILPRKLKEIEVPDVTLMKIDPVIALASCKKTKVGNNKFMLPPHIDKFRKTSINFYINTNGEQTKYFSKSGEGLVEELEFIAKNGECWALNVNKPHAVILSPPHVRVFVTASFFNTDYETVLQVLQEEGAC